VLADEVFDWLSQQPAWQRDLARRLVAQIELDNNEYAEAVLMIKHLHQVPIEGAAQAPKPLERDDMAADAAGGVVRLLGLGSLQGVGLVVEGEQLTFGDEGLTIIYGDNGAGKSSYVGALKKLCRTVDFDCHVRSSIFDLAPPAPSAKIKTSTGGQIGERRTPLAGDGIVRLPGMSVFDSACAELYVDRQNTIQYVPTELRLLSRLATLQDRVRGDLHHEHALLKGTEPAIGDYPPTTTVGRALRGLRGTAADPDLALLSKLSDNDIARRDQLRAAIAAAAASTSEADAAAAEQDTTNASALVVRLEDLAARVSYLELETLRTALELNQQAQAAVELAAERLEGPIDGVGGEPWRLMWEAARQFVQASGQPFPPRGDDHCPLCLQTVSDGAAERLAHFEAHIESTLTATALARTAEMNTAMARVSPAHASVVSDDPLLVALRRREPELGDEIDHAIGSIRIRLETISDDAAAIQTVLEDGETTAERSTPDVATAATALQQWSDARGAHAATLRATDDASTLTALQDELAELDARTRLGEELSRFAGWRASLSAMRALDNAHSALATNRITTAQRELTQNEIAKALNHALTEELAGLACRLPVKLLTQTARAETSVALGLHADDPPPVSAIASEGEQRAIALSFFFAELQVANDLGGIVLDDPVSSLDDERRVYIAARLIAEAQRRQVIVFTHDLPFVFDLKFAAKRAYVRTHYQCIWRQGDSVGRVDDDPPFKTLALSKRIKKLEVELQQIKMSPAANLDEGWNQVDGFYSRLRTCWERAVEERLFGGVVERFERNVKTQQFKDVRVTPELLRQVDAGMTRASRFLHEDSYRAQVPLPSLTDMAEDLERLRQFDRDASAATPML
jgi:energy-coupling factor transporter ATP-binding protein EcfA2